MRMMTTRVVEVMVTSSEVVVVGSWVAVIVSWRSFPCKVGRRGARPQPFPLIWRGNRG